MPNIDIHIKDDYTGDGVAKARAEVQGLTADIGRLNAAQSGGGTPYQSKTAAEMTAQVESAGTAARASVESVGNTAVTAGERGAGGIAAIGAASKRATAELEGLRAQLQQLDMFANRVKGTSLAPNFDEAREKVQGRISELEGQIAEGERRANLRRIRPGEELERDRVRAEAEDAKRMEREAALESRRVRPGEDMEAARVRAEAEDSRRAEASARREAMEVRQMEREQNRRIRPGEDMEAAQVRAGLENEQRLARTAREEQAALRREESAVRRERGDNRRDAFQDLMVGGMAYGLGRSALGASKGMFEQFEQAQTARTSFRGDLMQRGEGGAAPRIEREVMQIANEGHFADWKSLEVGAERLGTFEVKAKDIERVLPAVARQARAMGQTIEMVSNQFGKAVESGNLGFLRRGGLILNADETASIKAAARVSEAARQAATIDAIIGAVNRQTATLPNSIGPAQAAMNDLSRTWYQLIAGDATGKGAELGKGIADGFTSGAHALQHLIDLLNAHSTLARWMGRGLVGGGAALTLGGGALLARGGAGIIGQAFPGLGNLPGVGGLFGGGGAAKMQITAAEMQLRAAQMQLGRGAGGIPGIGGAAALEEDAVAAAPWYGRALPGVLGNNPGVMGTWGGAAIAGSLGLGAGLGAADDYGAMGYKNAGALGDATGVATAAAAMFLPGAAIPIAIAEGFRLVFNQLVNKPQEDANPGDRTPEDDARDKAVNRKSGTERARYYESQVAELTRRHAELTKPGILENPMVPGLVAGAARSYAGWRRGAELKENDEQLAMALANSRNARRESRNEVHQQGAQAQRDRETNDWRNGEALNNDPSAFQIANHAKVGGVTHAPDMSTTVTLTLPAHPMVKQVVTDLHDATR